MLKKLLVLCLVFIALSNASAKAKTIGPVNMDMLPTRDILGAPLTYQSKYYLVDFWATWCPPCQMTIPELVTLQNSYPTKNLQVIGMYIQSPEQNVREFMIKYKINYPLALGEPYLNNFPPFRGIPTMFLLDKNKKVLKTYVGYTPAKTFSADIDQLLKSSKPASKPK